jgi:very-short-patch-repair endonuclease
MRQTTRKTVLMARALRRDMTPPERRLWAALRTRPDGFKFRCQRPTGPYSADFYCPAAKLVIEIDGIAHEMGNNVERDLRRDALMAERGYRVIRVPAIEIKNNLDGVLQHILGACRA